jgi:predicted CXXCH cytochrome family protein
MGPALMLALLSVFPHKHNLGVNRSKLSLNHGNTIGLGVDPGIVLAQPLFNLTDDSSSCKFCHTRDTPRVRHKAAWDRNEPSSTVWGTASDNRGLKLSQGFGDHSLACVSCHDGTSVVAVPLTVLPTVKVSNNPTPAQVVTAPQAEPGNHPVSIRMPSIDNGVGAYNGTSTSPVVKQGGYNTITAAKATGIVFYADAANPDVFGIECGSCHEPHDNTSGSFLRVTLEESKLCTSCHLQ